MVGLFDIHFHEDKIKQYQPPLSKLDKIINWDIFREAIQKALYIEPKGLGGRPPFDRLMMFKIIILQKYYNLSDEQTEFQINDRTSFKLFLGLSIGDTTPDEKIIWHFKEQLTKKDLSQSLFDLFTKELMSNNIIVNYCF